MKSFDLQRKSRQLAESLDEYVKSNFDKLVEDFLESFCSYCDKIYKMQQQGKKGAVCYIHFSVLRTNILLRKHEIRLDAYDENWYMDLEECSGSYAAGEIYSYLDEYGELLEELRRESPGMVSLAKAQERIFSESRIYLFYVAELIRAGMKKAVQTEAYQRIRRGDCFVVCIGGFLDKFDILYKEDHRVKDSREVRRYLESEKRTVYSYEICENLDLSKGNYEGLEFQYSSFAGCDFTGGSWNKSRLLFCNFQNTILKDAKMEGMKIFDTDFSGAKLENVSFAGGKLKHLSFTGAVLFQVDFSKALLAEEINFEGAEMVDCNLPESR